MLQENDCTIPTSWVGLSYILDPPFSISLTVRALNFKHIQGATTMLFMVWARFFPPLCKCDQNMNFNLTTVFKWPKRATKWVRLSCKIKQQNPGKLLNLESLFPGRALFKTRFQFYFIILVDTKRKWTKATVNTAEKSRRWWYSMEYELKVFF